MIDKLIHLLGGCTKSEYKVIENEYNKMAEKYISTVSNQTKQIKELETAIEELKNTQATKFTLCVEGGKVWIE